MAKTLIFVDTDLLFSFFAINNEKLMKYREEGTTDDEKLDIVLGVISNIEDNKDIICISEISILELVTLLKRRNSEEKIPNILTKIYEIGDVLPISDHMIKLAWFIGSNYKLHTGDALHLAFCLSSDIKDVLIIDAEFYDACMNIKEDFKNKGSAIIEDFFTKIPFAQTTPDKLLKKLNNLSKINFQKIAQR